MDMYEKFAKLLKQSGESAFSVAKATGIPPSTFSDWKSGKSVPKTEKLTKIAEHFGLSASYFINDQALSDIDFALWGEVRSMSDEEKQDIYDYIMYKRQKSQSKSQEDK